MLEPEDLKAGDEIILDVNTDITGQKSVWRFPDGPEKATVVAVEEGASSENAQVVLLSDINPENGERGYGITSFRYLRGYISCNKKGGKE